ncbi:hypothetical protein [uncultured Brevundimonas sp.]|uniref:HTH-like domain-containing protein n=1 Tax=uncultured Brevundimonas sp. TaxID=213418 RepID=UPI002616A87A|nr:hypothetical protein [uncultured Brevundimonas sp.]
MTSEQLASALKDAVERAPHGKRVVFVHLFGIAYSEFLKGRNTKEIAALAGIPESYGVEISKGANLAPFVTING